MTLGFYFGEVVDLLLKKARIGSTAKENTDKGSNREHVCKLFLENHIPGRLTVDMGGDIFGLKQEKSGQIDIIVAHDSSISFRENHKPQFPIESVSAAISVKSNLTSAELKKALLNLATIPQPTESIVNLSPLNRPFWQYKRFQPPLFVFAYKGVGIKKCIETMEKFYSTNYKVPLNRVPRGIIVLGQYMVYLPHHQYDKYEAGATFNASQLVQIETRQDQRGFALFYMMVEISRALGWLDGTHFDFYPYLSEAYNLPPPRRVVRPTVRFSAPSRPTPPRPKRY